MYEMAPSIPRGAIEDASGNEAVLATMVFLAIAAWHAGRDALRRDGWRCWRSPPPLYRGPWRS